MASSSSSLSVPLRAASFGQTAPNVAPSPGGSRAVLRTLLTGFALAASLSPPSAFTQTPEHAFAIKRLDARRQEQEAIAKNFTAFHGFRLTDRVSDSGITFLHQVVDDAARDYKAAHYDHGNGLAAADIDSDGVPDLYFTTQLGSNRLYRNLGQGRFEDLTDPAGVGMTDQISSGASFGDIDNDGDPDLFVTTIRHGNRLFENLGGGRFRDITQSAGVAYSGHSSSAVLFDYDRDGLLDIFVVNVGVFTEDKRGPGGYFLSRADAFQGHLYPERTELSILYRNLGNRRFEDVSRRMGLQDGSWSGDATALDLNQDLYPDLYVVNMQGDNHYYQNRSGAGFTDTTVQHFPKTPWGAMGVKALDYNRDGLMDIFVTDMHSDMTRPQTEQALGFLTKIEKAKSEAYCAVQWPEAYYQGTTNNLFGNAFYRNLGGGRFEEVSDALGVETYWPWGISAGDLNADGFEDLFVSAGMGYPFRYAINSVLLNERGSRFFDGEFLLGVEPRASGRTEKVWFTLDCGGADKLHPLCAGQTGRVAVPGTLSTRSSVILDLDADGDLDLVTHEFFDRPQLLMSDLSTRKPIHYLSIKLVGTKSNRDALGSHVTVRAAGIARKQYHEGKSGYLGQSSLPLYFGLGDGETVEGVEVLWPSGRRTQLAPPIRANRVLRIEEPGE